MAHNAVRCQLAAACCDAGSPKDIPICGASLFVRYLQIHGKRKINTRSGSRGGYGLVSKEGDKPLHRQQEESRQNYGGEAIGFCVLPSRNLGKCDMITMDFMCGFNSFQYC